MIWVKIMCNMKRVVVTGLGLITPLGDKIDSVWEKLINGESGIGYIDQFDTTNTPTKICGKVKEFNPEEFINKKDLRRMDRYLQFSIVAAQNALKDSGLAITEENSSDIGVIIGSGIGGMHTLEEQFKVLHEKGPDKISPFFIPMMIANMAAGSTAIHLGLKGPNMSIVTACASGAHSIGMAYELIKKGEISAAFAGGSEAAITTISVAGFSAMKALSTRNDEPKKASRPYDKNRDGFVMAEGAGIIVLEELEHAKARNAKIYAKISGFGASADSYHITNPEPEGKGASIAMRRAINNAGINPEDVNYINSHGTSTPPGDKTETLAIKNVFRENAKNVSISSTKSMLGHLLGAAGAVESIICILAVLNDIIPPTINIEEPDPECDLDYTPNKAVKKTVNYAMNNSFGFGGQNAVLIFKKYKE